MIHQFIGYIVAKFRSLTKSDWLVIITCVAIGLLLLFAFRSCDNAKSQKPAKAAKDSVVKVVTIQDQRVVRKVDSLQVVVDSLKKELAQYKKAKVASDKNLDAAEKEVAGLVNDLADAKLHNDTASYARNCDSLAITASKLIDQAEQHQILFDQTIENYDLQLVIKDSVAAEQSRMLAQFRATVGDLSSRYNDLYKQNESNRKKANRRNAMNRLLAIVAASAAAAFLLKQ